MYFKLSKRKSKYKIACVYNSFLKNKEISENSSHRIKFSTVCFKFSIIVLSYYFFVRADNNS